MAETAANAAPAGLPPCPLVVGDPPVPGEEICWGDTVVGDAPGGKVPVAFVRRIGCFCRLTWNKNKVINC